MPIYGYRCSACGHQKDVLQKMSDSPLTECPACGAASFSKEVSAPAFQLKGTGWYVTDFRDNNKNGKGESKSGESASEGSGASGSKSGEAKSGESKAAPADGGSASGSSDGSGNKPAPAPAPAATPAASSPSSSKS